MYVHLEKELARQVTITENGRKRRLSKEELIVASLANKAAKGDARAIAMIGKMREDAKNPWLNETEENMVITMHFENEADLTAINARHAAAYRALMRERHLNGEPNVDLDAIS